MLFKILKFFKKKPSLTQTIIAEYPLSFIIQKIKTLSSVITCGYAKKIKSKKSFHYKYSTRFKRAKKYGWKYLWDKDFRKQVYGKISRDRYRKNVGGAWSSNVKRRKRSLFKRDGNICFWCGDNMTFATASIDHIKPVSEGGSNHLENLRLIHIQCHQDMNDAIKRGDFINI